MLETGLTRLMEPDHSKTDSAIIQIQMDMSLGSSITLSFDIVVYLE